MIAHQSRTFRWQGLAVVAGAVAMMIAAAILNPVARGQSELGDDTRGSYELIVSWSPNHPDGLRKLYAVPPDGSGPRRLIPGSPDDTFREFHPDVAPDGRVVFVSGPEGNTNRKIVVNVVRIIRASNHQ